MMIKSNCWNGVLLESSISNRLYECCFSGILQSNNCYLEFLIKEFAFDPVKDLINPTHHFQLIILYSIPNLLSICGIVDYQQIQMKQSVGTQNPRVDAQVFTQLPVKIRQEKKQVAHSKNEVQAAKKQSLFQKASHLLDNITENLYNQLSDGKLNIVVKKMDVEQIQQSPDNSPKVRVKTTQPEVNIEQHKKLVKKFMTQNKKFRRNIEMRSVQIMQKIKTQEQRQKSKRKQQKMRTLQLRRSQITRRLAQRQVKLKQIKRNSFTQGQNYYSLKSKKFYYQIKQQQYQHNIVQKKKQQQQRIINRQKERMKPMNIKDILEHQKFYQKKMNDQRLNRNVHSQRLEQQWDSYNPPEFVPRAYLLAAQEDRKNKEQQEKRLRMYRINQIKKKKFLQALQEIKNAEKQFSLSKSKSPKKSPRFNESQQKTRRQIDPNQKIQKGNNYLKEVLQKVKKSKKKNTNIPAYNQAGVYRKKKVKSQYQLQIVKEQRIQQVQKIRYRKIDQIMKSQEPDEEKLDKLRFQVRKFDKIARQKFRTASKRKQQDLDNIMDRNEGASLMMSSIYAKLAILHMTQDLTKKHGRLRTTN